MRHLILSLFFLPTLLYAKNFDVPVGEFERKSFQIQTIQYPIQISCKYSFNELRFNEDWGPSLILTLRHQDESKPFVQFSTQVTSSDNRYVFSYRQGFGDNEKPWEVRYLAAPFKNAELMTAVIVYENGVVDFSSSVGNEVFGNGRIITSLKSIELATLSISSSTGEYACESL